MWATWAPWSMVGPCSVQCVGETGEQSRRRTRGCPVSVMTCDATQVELEYFACMGDGTPGERMGVGERERERERERRRQRQRQREKETETDRQTDRQRQRERQTEREGGERER